MTALYPEIEPDNSGYLEVGDEHKLYWETSGNPHGVPIVFLHGGPGSGSAPWQRQLYNPDKYKIILFDQRGSGKSTPHASLENNTTPDLVEDMEKLRKHLRIDSWHITGGSWGSTLALAYANEYPERVRSLAMYGIFLSREEELRDLYFDGGVNSRVYPDVFDDYFDLLPEESLGAEMSNPDFVLAHSLVENHYFINGSFMDGNALLESLPQKLENIPVHIIQGRYDMVCPFKTAWDLHKALPNSTLHIIDDVGHTAKEPKTTQKLVEVFDSLIEAI